jgi:hypothetical protein
MEDQEAYEALMSSTPKHGGPAFPEPCTSDGNPANTRTGMSLRDYFAAHVIIPEAGLSLEHMESLKGEARPKHDSVSATEWYKWEAEAEALYRYMQADAMLKARNL